MDKTIQYAYQFICLDISCKCKSITITYLNDENTP